MRETARGEVMGSFLDRKRPHFFPNRPWMRRGAVALLAMLLAVGLSACGKDAPLGSLAQGQGYVAGDGTLTLIDPAQRGDPVEVSGPLLGQEGELKLSDLRGNVVVLNVWASWCAPCRKEAPDLEAAWKSLQGKPVRFVGVNTRDGSSQDAALAFVRRYGLTYPSLVDADSSRMLAFRDLPPTAVPATLIVDRQGRLAARVLGPVNETTLVGLVQDELARGADGAAAGKNVVRQS